MICCSIIQPIFDVSYSDKRRNKLENVAESLSLVRAVGELKVAECQEVRIKRVFSGTFFSKHFLISVNQKLRDKSIGLVFINCNISPIQQRNIEKILRVRVIDRTGLILEIFSKRAKSFEGRLQVDLAKLSYQKTRLVRTWSHLERQRGGKGFLGGPGEKQIESDRRQISASIKSIKLKLLNVEKTQRLHRDSRSSLQLPFVTLVGYTNVGKTSLFNSLTKSSNLEKNMLFATLDATARRVVLPSSKSIILSDTVGFISNLPTQLVQSFKSTLEAVTHSDLILHIIDVSSPFAVQERLEVIKVLKDLNIDFNRTNIVEIGNKSDLVEDPNMSPVAETLSLTLSVKKDMNFDELLRVIDLSLAETLQKESIVLKLFEGKKRAWLLNNKLVQNERYLDDCIELDVRWTLLQKKMFLNLR